MFNFKCRHLIKEIIIVSKTNDNNDIFIFYRDPAPRLSSVLETPSKIIRLDVSLNELKSIPHDGLLPFRNLRALDASLNQIKQ